MAHSLILGMTESGKTTLAKRLAQHYKSRGIGVIVLDPLNDDWPCDFKTADPDEFLRVYWIPDRAWFSSTNPAMPLGDTIRP
jgi:DNA helicase HerA-like ATPase